MDERRLLAELLRRPLHDARVGELLEAHGGLGRLAWADDAVLRRTGMTIAARRDLRRARDLAVVLARSTAANRPQITSASQLADYVRCALAHLPREQFRVLFLDRRNRLLRNELVADGSVDHAPVYPREVIRRALEVSASALILAHNHPSGDPTPSQADIQTTRQIVEAARLFDLQVHDHIIVGGQGTASLRALGLWP